MTAGSEGEAMDIAPKVRMVRPLRLPMLARADAGCPWRFCVPARRAWNSVDQRPSMAVAIIMSVVTRRVGAAPRSAAEALAARTAVWRAGAGALDESAIKEAASAAAKRRAARRVDERGRAETLAREGAP